MFVTHYIDVPKSKRVMCACTQLFYLKSKVHIRYTQALFGLFKRAKRFLR